MILRVDINKPHGNIGMLTVIIYLARRTGEGRGVPPY